MRRRFAGQAFGDGTALPADTLAAATEALKQAQEGLKGSRGGRLGPGSQAERDEGAKAVSALPTMASPTAAAAATPQLNISSLRSALGIDQLLAGLQGVGMGSQMEMPQFEMPQFEMPQFEMPDWESLLSSYKAQPETPAEIEQTPQGTKKAATRIKVGNKKYNLSKKGGSELERADIKYLQNKGWTAGQLQKLASKVPSAGRKVLPGAQKMISALRPKSSTSGTKAAGVAKSMSTGAKKAIAKATSKSKKK